MVNSYFVLCQFITIKFYFGLDTIKKVILGARILFEVVGDLVFSSKNPLVLNTMI